MKPIRTARLTLVPATTAHLEAELEEKGGLATLLHAQVSSEWPAGEYDRDAMQFFHERLSEGGESVLGWYGWYAVLESIGCRKLIGTGGFFGPPVADEAEIGYSVLESCRGHGYATEIVTALGLFAASRGVRSLRARTAPSNSASKKVLDKNGFVYQAETADGQLLFLKQVIGRS